MSEFKKYTGILGHPDCRHQFRMLEQIKSAQIFRLCTEAEVNINSIFEEHEELQDKVGALEMASSCPIERRQELAKFKTKVATRSLNMARTRYYIDKKHLEDFKFSD
jgi:hypothetical protein